jgi:uracil-DNA glycosylase family 4
VPTDIRAVRDAIIACDACPRLRTYCQRVGREKNAAHRDDVYWARPVPGFGDPEASVLVLGLAPAAHGANRTGRVFTGDVEGGSGDFLMHAMHDGGFANIPTSRHPEDGLALDDAFISAAVRCAPPDNKPTPDEIRRCHVHLAAEVAALPRIQVVVALGRIAFDAYWRLIGARGVAPKPRPPFAHGTVYRPAGAPALICSYHPSRQNTNTGKLTPRMMAQVFTLARRELNPRIQRSVGPAAPRVGRSADQS